MLYSNTIEHRILYYILLKMTDRVVRERYMLVDVTFSRVESPAAPDSGTELRVPL